MVAVEALWSEPAEDIQCDCGEPVLELVHIDQAHGHVQPSQGFASSA